MSGHSKWHNIQQKKGKTDAAELVSKEKFAPSVLASDIIEALPRVYTLPFYSFL